MNRLSERFKDLVLSVYLYNEWRGYQQLYQDLIPRLEADPATQPQFLTEVRKHAADEKKHYLLFRRYFEREGRMPFAVGPSIGYFDFLAHWLVGNMSLCVAADEQSFARLCRAIVTTELRGIRQVEAILRWRSVRDDHRLRNIFRVVRRDEPSHFGPYLGWLAAHGCCGPSAREKSADFVIHYGIALIVIPLHFLNFRLQRMSSFAA